MFGHQDFEHDLEDNVRLTFKWAPYAENLTHILQAWTAHSEAPTSVVMSAGLWHMLHVTNASGYQQGLGNLKAAASRFLSAQSTQKLPGLAFFSISEVPLSPEPCQQHVDSSGKSFQIRHARAPASKPVPFHVHRAIGKG